MSRLLFLFLVAFSFYGYAQSPGSYSTKHYSDINGLPQNSIKSIAKDDAGYLWLTTEGGLIRFDGEHFILFNKQHTHTRSNRMYVMKRDLNTGALYAQTEYHELIPITKGNVIPKPVIFKQIFPNVTPQKQVQEFPLIQAKGLNSSIQTTASSYYNITKDTLFFHNNKQIVATPFKHDEQFNFFVSGEQLFHYASNGNFTLIENGKTQQIPLQGDLTKAKGAQPTGLKIYWNTVTGQTFFYLNKAIYQVTYHKNVLNSKLIINGFDLEEKPIWAMYYDVTARKLFLGSPTHGLFVLQQHLFQAEKQKKELNSSVKYALYPFTNHSVLFANGDLVQTDGRGVQLPLVMAYSGNFAIVIDEEKNIWTTKGSSIHKLSPKGDQLLQSFNLPEQVNSLSLDQQRLWIGTFGGVYTKDLAKPDATPNLVLKIDRVSVLRKTKERLWIGTYNGLFKYDLIRKKLTAIPEMAKMHIRDLVIRGEEVWICTYGDGFYLYNNGLLKKMPLDQFGYLNAAHCILEDARGFFWISTNKGLFQVAVKDLLAYNKGQVSQVYYQYYNTDYGFNTNEFNGGCQPCGAILKDGHFTFPSLVGSVMFNPLLFTTCLPDKPIYIDKIFHDQVSMKTSDTVSIGQDFDRLNIWVSSPYFGNPDNLNLEYKLTTEENWGKLNGDPIITFSKLTPGKHELLIRKPAGFGSHFTYKKLTIIVEPYFYQTWWFSALVVLFVLGSIFYFLKKRTQHIILKNERLENLVKKRTEELEKNIVNLEESQYLLNQQATFQKKLLGAITHDLKSPLKYMTIMGKQLYQHEAANDGIKDSMRAIYISANSMYHLTENLLNYSKLFLTEKTSKNDYINLNFVVAEKIQIFSEIAKYNVTVIHNNIPEEVILYTNRVMLTLIIHNLLDNAIKFCPNGHITFGAKSTREKVSFWVHDTGCGMPDDITNWLNAEEDRDITDGLGLKMVKEFAAKMNMQIEVNSNVDEGTNVKFTLKHNN
ncbi:sensor histidine kinase [Pedobacter nyackensis]|uniref:histidine kinase n=1 Tax=Pedobacter nyackensis TaxID=475255 RepID=A0A1W2C6U0_9SPHI|nr:HAMP domain-containing sensor histidine kinase [Pedobacter nyackensis]SMC80831.1 Signal transduction histidine kinase [Pedobacter nyackensis]